MVRSFKSLLGDEIALAKPVSLSQIELLDDNNGELDVLLNFDGNMANVSPVVFEKLFLLGLPKAAFSDAVYFVPSAFDAVVSSPSQSLSLVNRIIDFCCMFDVEMKESGIWISFQLEVWHCFNRVVNSIRCEFLSRSTIIASSDHGAVNVIAALLSCCDRQIRVAGFVDSMLIHLACVGGSVLVEAVSICLLPDLEIIENELLRRIAFETERRIKHGL